MRINEEELYTILDELVTFLAIVRIGTNIVLPRAVQEAMARANELIVEYEDAKKKAPVH